MLKSSSRNCHLDYDTYDINLGIEKGFTKYVKEICW